MSTSLDNRRALVVGATRGLGRGVALALAAAGARVNAVGRSQPGLQQLADDLSTPIDTLVADATDPVDVARLVARTKPELVVLAAGAQPTMKPIDEQSWETFSRPWEVDTKAAFLFTQELMRREPVANAELVVFSSGAALHGSALSGGYAGAKQMQRLLLQYAAAEIERRGLDLRVSCVLPQLNPHTDLGRAGIAAYAARAGVDEETFVKERFGDTPLSPAIAGDAIVSLLTDAQWRQRREVLLTGGGLKALPS